MFVIIFVGGGTLLRKDRLKITSYTQLCSANVNVQQEELMSFGLVFASVISYWNGMSACRILLLRLGSSREYFWDSNTLANKAELRGVVLSSLLGRTGAKQPEKRGTSIKKKS